MPQDEYYLYDMQSNTGELVSDPVFDTDPCPVFDKEHDYIAQRFNVLVTRVIKTTFLGVAFARLLTSHRYIQFVKNENT